MFLSFKLKSAVKILIIPVAIIVFLIIINTRESAAKTVSDYKVSVLVLDPGHGGIDGGAIAKSGVKESDINLDIALKTAAIADFVGVKTVLTRETDTDGFEDGTYSERQNLLNRVETVNSINGAVLVSIHQNQYPSELVRGAEVMYASTEGSMELAQILQDNLITQIDSENRRVARPAPEELLLTSSIGCTGVLMECGFMSCPEEAEKLCSRDYQLKISEIIIASYIKYTAHNCLL